jgi:hypothetical protein
LGRAGDDDDFFHESSPVGIQAWDLRYSVVVMPA